MEVLEYLDHRGSRPFAAWFERLNAHAAAKVAAALSRLEAGNTSNVKGAGTGLFELRVDFGPGYRIYFGKDGDAIVILLAGGSKSRQQEDIDIARVRWRDYKLRKKIGKG